MLELIARYPVKSMLGEQLDGVSVEADGIVGDRTWGVHDVSSGLVASAKYPARFERLLSCRAAILDDSGGVPEVHLPSGQSGRCGDRELDACLSELLGARVELRPGHRAGAALARTDPPEDGTVDGRSLGPVTKNPVASGTPGAARLFDFAPLHVVARTTLDALAATLPSGAAAMARFRPNLVVDIDVAPFGESAWVDSRVTVGAAELSILLPTPRCVVPTLQHGGLEQSRDLLRVLTRLNRRDISGLGAQTCLGIYAAVSRSGFVRVRDPVTVG